MLPSLQVRACLGLGCSFLRMFGWFRRCRRCCLEVGMLVFDNVESGFDWSCVLGQFHHRLIPLVSLPRSRLLSWDALERRSGSAGGCVPGPAEIWAPIVLEPLTERRAPALKNIKLDIGLYSELSSVRWTLLTSPTGLFRVAAASLYILCRVRSSEWNAWVPPPCAPCVCAEA